MFLHINCKILAQKKASNLKISILDLIQAQNARFQIKV